MRPMQRLVSAAVLIALASALTGCGGASSWDPSDLLDFMDTKKKLPGDRKPVFPEGVPGLEQGVPRDLYKESVERQQAEQAAAAAAAAAPPQQAAPPSQARKSKSRSRGDVEVGNVRQDGAASTDEGGAAAVEQPPAGRKITRRRTTAPPPEEPAAAAPAAPAQQQPSSAFPAPMPSGSFSR